MNVRNWNLVKNFDFHEFDSPGDPGSGRFMKEEFILLLDKAREEAGIPFVINSGIRTPERNKKVGGAKNSAHLKGWAADIKVFDNESRRIILNALIKVGLDKRIGISDTFIHVDNDPDKRSTYWTYPSKKGVVSMIKTMISRNKPEDI